eukprot:SAG31_NODE_5188_length_2691_cov_1.557099_5_plen_139_part_00
MASWVIAAASAVVVLLAIFGPTLHQVPEGHVSVYWRGGALTEKIGSPGYHLKVPVITTYDLVQTSLQTDVVKDIPCGTRGGTIIEFARIEVVNRLQMDSVYSTIKAYGVGAQILKHYCSPLYNEAVTSLYCVQTPNVQ